MPARRASSPAARRTGAAGSRPSPDELGQRLRAVREERGMSLRALAKLIDVSPSFVSQVELGKASPSVGTLYALVNALGLSLGDVMPEEEAEEAPRPAVEPAGSVVTWPRSRAHVQRGDSRPRIRMAGVLWERLTPDDDPMVDFLYVTYEPGSASCPEEDLMRHGGREYGHVISGRLEIQVGFETYQLDGGDSINFDSATPHRLSNPFDVPAVAVWVVVDRRGDNRVTPTTNWESAHLPALM